VRDPEYCGDTECTEGGSWGATGKVPPGHHWHYTEHGGYLAHGKACTPCAKRWIEDAMAEYNATVAAAAERLALKVSYVTRDYGTKET
jgi:hypothetical protein